MSRIVFISYNYYPPYYSGKLIISGKRLQDLDPAKFQVTVLTGGLGGHPHREKVGNVSIFRSPYMGKGKIGGRLNVIAFWIWSIIKMLLARNACAVHFDEIGYFSIPIFDGLGSRLAWSHFTSLVKIARRRGMRTIFEHAISDTDDHFDPGKEKKKFLDHVEKIVCISDALYDSALQMYPDKAIKIVYGIEDELFKPPSIEDRANIRTTYRADDRHIILCFVGLVVKRKGFDLICEVFPKISEEFPDCRLWVIGPRSSSESRHIHDDEVEAYQKLLEPVKDKVNFFGNIADRQVLAHLIGATDIFLFPTRQEGFGLAPVEAMSCGVAPIIARIPGVTDLASIEGVTGLYIQPENASELQQAIRKLISDRNLRLSMGKASRTQILNHFSWKEHVEKWERLYGGD